jgi:hypothetical protein
MTRRVVTAGALVIGSIAVGVLLLSSEGVGSSHASVRGTSASCGWWSVHLPAVPDGSLEAVASSGPSDVWAVGSGDLGEPPLAMHWDGRSWRRILIAGRGDLRAVAVFAPDNVWAVGIIGGASGGLVVHWDGERWSRVATKPRDVSFSDVGGSGPDDVWAVGIGFRRDSSSYNVALHWNGVAWKSVLISSFPDVTTSQGNVVRIGAATLQGVAARAPDDAWAVGELNGYEGAFIQHWDGKRWRLSRLLGNAGDGLGRVEIISRNNVWAVSGPNGGNLVLRWNGREWSKPPQPHVNSVHGVAAAPNGVWIAEPPQRWNGRRWLRSSAPTGDYTLNGLTAISATDVWAVGLIRPRRPDHPVQPLALHYRCRK